MLRTTPLASALLLLSTASAVDARLLHSCSDFLIPINVTAQQYDLDITINTNWDVEDYVFNSTRRDTLQAYQPIIGNRSVTRLYTIGATFCTPKNATNSSGTVLVLTHGTMIDRSYWNPTFNGSSQYNFVQHALDAGFSVFFYDRLGTGKSDLPDPYTGSQFPAQVQILVSLTQKLRQRQSPYTRGTVISRVVHVGHSFGSYLTLAALTSGPTATLTDAIVLTGYSGQYQWLELFTAGGQARVAALAQPQKWSHLPHGYLVPVDVYSLSYGGFKTPYFDHAAAEWLHNQQSPYAIGEQLTAATVLPNLSAITVPVQVVEGRYDITQCGGNCDGVLNATAELYPNSVSVVVNGSFNAGHFLNYHHDAPEAFAAITEFVKKSV